MLSKNCAGMGICDFVMETQKAEQLKIVIVGHVDHGKSTFVGRLFHDTGSLPEGKLEQLQKVAERRGTPFEWANLMDALQAERDQNVTIDTAQIWFHTKKRQYVIIDAPGHKEFLKNMITGAASAHAALLLIDAQEGIQENSRRHGYLLSLLGIRQVAVLVNKMDLANYDQKKFAQIETEYRQWLSSIGVTPKVFIPIAAKHGDNIASKSTNMKWWSGSTVLETLDEFEVPKRQSGQPLRFPSRTFIDLTNAASWPVALRQARLKSATASSFLPPTRRARLKRLSAGMRRQPIQQRPVNPSASR